MNDPVRPLNLPFDPIIVLPPIVREPTSFRPFLMVAPSSKITFSLNVTFPVSVPPVRGRYFEIKTFDFSRACS